MSLRNLRKTITKDATLALAKKAKAAKTAKRQVTGGNSLIDKIKRAVDFTENVFGSRKNEYELIRTEEKLHEYIDVAINNGVIAIDTETTGLDPISDSIVGVCIYTPTQKPAYIPINHKSYITNARVDNQLTESQVSNEIKRIIENNVRSIFFNAKFDIRVMRHHLGIDVPPAWDGFIAAKLLNELEKENSLKYLHKIYCGNAEEAHYTFDKLFKDVKFSLIPINTAYLYAAKDAVMTYELYKYQEPLLTQDNEKCIELDYTRLASLYRDIELPLIPIVADIEDAGISLDLELAKQLSEKYHKMLDEKQQEIYEVIDKYSDLINDYKKSVDVCKLDDPINIASPVQLAILLYDILKLPIVDKNSPRGTGEPILEKLDHEICKHILEYRGIAKLLTTYIDKMPNALNPVTHKIHCNFHQIGADCVIGSTIIPTPNGIVTIQQICEDNIPNMLYNKFYELEIPIYNRYNQVEYTSHAIKFKDCSVIQLTFSDGTSITGTPDHKILCNDVFVELQCINIGDNVDSINSRNELVVVDKRHLVADVYDFKVPGTHSFQSNNVISHNTGRFSSSDPNMQNIPSHNKDIRRMFTASNKKDVECVDNKFVFFVNDEVECVNGYILSQNLTTNDVIKCNESLVKITNVEIKGVNVIVTIERNEMN